MTDLSVVHHILFGGLPPEAFDITVSVEPAVEGSEQADSQDTAKHHDVEEVQQRLNNESSS